MQPSAQLRQFTRRSVAAGLVAGVVLAAHVAPSHADLASRYSSHQKKAAGLRATIAQESGQIEGYEGSLRDLRARLATLNRSLSIQESALSGVRTDLTTARTRLRLLEGDLVRDRRILADELVSEYESPAPNLVGVVVNSHGFDQLLNGIAYLKRIEARNLSATRLVKRIRSDVTVQATRLTATEHRRARAAAAVLVERDQVAQIKLSIVDRELKVAHARSQDEQQLGSLRATLTREATQLNREAVAAQAAAMVDPGSGGAPVNGCANTAFVPHGGSYGFFPASGTNYSMGEEPVIAARLDVLGRSLQLHLVGISGYRSPQHSVEVGGFANDPHTQGAASDTPGVEGVPEATLERFCLTRPFPGPREADHIQEL